jgi:YHS domain-containing protein
VLKKLSLTVLVTLFSLASLFAQEATRKKQFNLEKGSLAIQGYDPVAYFTQNKAIKGSDQYQVSAAGVVYRFASEADKETFLKSPQKYEPQYGGWCAYAMGSSGEKVDIDPETFKITDGKLFLFYHSWANNTLNKWNKDEANLKTKADRNWSTIFK